MTAAHAGHHNYSGVATLDRVAFWESLPGVAELSREAKHLVRESDLDIRHNRLESALDASLAVNAIEPSFIPGFIRTAELLVATHRRDHAQRLLRTVSSYQVTFEQSTYDLEIFKIRAHVDPDVELSIRLAERIISDNETSLYVPYIPVAIEQLFQADRASESSRVARAWVDLNPADSLAIAYLVRAQLREDDAEGALQTIRRFRDSFAADSIWPENIVVSALAAIASDKLEPKWMAAGPVCQELRNGALDYQHVTALLEFLVPAVDSPNRALLFAGLLALNGEDHDEARALLETTATETPTETYIRGIGLGRLARTAGDSGARLSALLDAWKALEDPQANSVAESGSLFNPPATQVTIGMAVANLHRESEDYSAALTVLNGLIQSGHNDPDVLRLRAEIMGQSGSAGQALEQLETLLQQQEEHHRYQDAVETLETMVRLAPGNVRLRGRLVDNCLKVGRFDQAIQQLVLQGRLLHKAGKLVEAEPPLHRAIEIATMVGDWDRISKLHQLLISFNPEETRLRHSAVATYVQYGRTADAMNQLREIVRLARKRNDPDEAIAASHQMLALDPNDANTYHQLGELLISIQEFGQADRVYRRLGTILPDDPVVKAKRSAIAALSRSRQGSR